MAWNLPHTGELRARLRFDRSSLGANVGGVVLGVWAPFIKMRSAKLEPTRGGIEVTSERLDGKAIYDLWVRSDSQTRLLKPGDRAVDLRTDVIYALGQPIDPNDRRQWLLIQATTSDKKA